MILKSDNELMGPAVSKLVRLASVYVRPHERMAGGRFGDGGKFTHVDGYVRKIDIRKEALAAVEQFIRERQADERFVEPAKITRRQATAKVRELVDRPKVRAAVSLEPAAMVGVLERGRYLPALEERTKVKDYSKKVGEMEAKLYGPIDEHPVYGVLTEAGENSGWGGVSMVLKPEVRSRTAIFFGDSGLRSFQDSPLAPQMWDDADYHSIDWVSNTADAVADAKTVDDIEPYVEAQIFGGVSTDDIEQVVLSSLRTERQLEDAQTLGTSEEAYLDQIHGVELRSRLTDLGIPWSDRD